MKRGNQKYFTGVNKEGIVEDLSGSKFGQLLVIRKLPKISNIAVSYICLCDCGIYKNIQAQSLKNGVTKSCGCLRIKATKERCQTHGNRVNRHKTDEYVAWTSMKERCYNEKNTHYKRYGGRGIIVCDRWRHSFEIFLADMGKKPSPKHSIDRIDNDGNYEPSNCRWATKKMQYSNRSDNRWLEYKGVRLILSDWSRKLKIDNASMYYQLSKNTFEESVEYFVSKKGITL
jgi:hypothetical protein